MPQKEKEKKEVKWRNPFKTDPEVKAAYEKAKREARLERARKEGRKAGLTKPKSFIDQLGKFGDSMIGSSGGLFSEPPRKRRKRKRRKS